MPVIRTEAAATIEPTGVPVRLEFAQKAFIVHDDRLLLVRKSASDPLHPGRWEVPGGRLEVAGDLDLDDHIRREVWEEVGLEIEPGPPFHLWRTTPWMSKERSRVWTRETRPLVEGEPLTPFTRAALAAEFVSPLTHMGTEGLHFINADYTLCLSRLPKGDLIGLESNGHLSDEGVAVGQCTIYDESGPIGFGAVTAVAHSVKMRIN